MQIIRTKIAKSRAHRSGVVVLELILTMPAFLLIMLAIVQISLIYVVSEQTAYASRYAAKIASDTTQASLPALNTGALKTIVDNVLMVGEIPLGSCRVVLEHNVGAAATINDPAMAADGCDCDPPGTSLPVVVSAVNTESVRATVCVRLNGNIPDFLDSFGFSIEDYVVEHSTTYLYKL